MKSAAISLTLIICLVVSTPLAAQDHGHFFFFVAPGDATTASGGSAPRIQLPTNETVVHVGGGGEGVLGNAWGVGTDFGGLVRAGGVGRVATISVDGFCHPLGQHHLRVDPYLKAGYGWFLGADAGRTLGLPNLGGGLNSPARGPPSIQPGSQTGAPQLLPGRAREPELPRSADGRHVVAITKPHSKALCSRWLAELSASR